VCLNGLVVFFGVFACFCGVFNVCVFCFLVLFCFCMFVCSVFFVCFCMFCFLCKNIDQGGLSRPAPSAPLALPGPPCNGSHFRPQKNKSQENQSQKNKRYRDKHDNNKKNTECHWIENYKTSKSTNIKKAMQKHTKTKNTKKTETYKNHQNAKNKEKCKNIPKQQKSQTINNNKPQRHKINTPTNT